MKKRKVLSIALLTIGLISLTSCSALFNDDDMSIYNSFNDIVSIPKSENPGTGVSAGGVEAIENSSVPDAYCFKNICYHNSGVITNTYKEGGINHTEYNVNGGNDFTGDKSNNYDLYVPKGVSKTDKHTVVLFIHGGAWISGFKTDVNPYVFEFANRGYISATLKYTLLKKSMDDASLSLFRDLDEIDACIGSIKSVLGELGFDTTKTNLVIGGASSGAHLTMLYAFSRGDKCPLPIKFLIDAVGPTDLKPANWKKFSVLTEEALDAGLSYSAISTQQSNGNLSQLKVADNEAEYYWNDYQTMRIANGMCGIPYTTSEIEATTDENKAEILHPNAASNSMTKAGGGEDLVSVTYWLAQKPANRVPLVCAYAGMDSIVGIAQFANLQHALDSYGVSYDYVYFRNSEHSEITKEKDPTKYEEFVNAILARLAAI